jgi:predicted HD superfamily hydrolase involved in NAD metabolism
MNEDYIYRFAFEHLTDERKKHTEGVRRLAKELASIYGEDTGRMDLAASCHDMFRRASNKTIRQFIEESLIGPEYKDNINLAHGPMASSYMKNKLGVDDKEILNAVRYHTTGRPEMTRFEKILFIADMAEEGRSYPEAEHIRKTAKRDLDLACYEALSSSISHLKGKERKIDRNTLDAYEEFKRLYEKEKH